MAESPSNNVPSTVSISSQIATQQLVVKPKKIFPTYLETKDVSSEARVLCEILTNSMPEEIEPALATAGVHPSPELVEEVLKLSYGCPASAVKFFRWAGVGKKHLACSWNLMVDLLGKNEMFELMWDAIRSMKLEDLLTVGTFGSVFGSYCVAGRFSEAIMTFDVMERHGVKPDVVAVNSLLSAICREGNQSTKALEFFEKVKMKIPPNADTFAILSEGCEKVGDVAREGKTFGEMAEIPCSYTPSTVAISSQIATTQQLVVKPKKIFPMYLETKGISPEARVLCEILTNLMPQEIETALATAGIQPSPELVEEVLKLSYGCPAAAVKFFWWAGVGKKHSACSWNLMVDLLGKNEMFELMWDAIRSMKLEDLLTVGTFGSVFGSYCVAGRFSEAVMTFDVMERHGVKPDVVAVNSLLSAICREGNQRTKALELFEKVKMKIPPNADTFAILSQGCEKVGDVAREGKTFGEMAGIPCSYTPSTVAISSQIATTQQLVVKPKKIFPTYLEMKGVSREARVLCEILTNSTPQEIETALATAGVQPSPELVEEVLKLSYGCPAAAMKFFWWAGVGKKHSAHLWNLMVDLLGKNEMFEPMWDAVRSMKQESLLTAGTFVSVFGSYCVAGRFSEAVMTFDVMESHGVKPDVVAVNSLLSAICREGNQATRALDFFENIKMKIPPNADTLAILLEQCEKEGDVATVRKTFREMAEILYSYAPSTVAISSQIATPKQLVVEPKKIFPTVLETKDVSPEARVLCEILTNSTLQEIETALATAGVQPSPELVEEVLKLSYGCPAAAVKFFWWAGVEKKHSAHSWNLMVDLLGKNEMFEPMWDAVRSMKQESLLTVGTFVSVFGSYCVAGRFSQAVMAFDVMERYGVKPDVVAVNSLLSAICREDNQIIKALEFFEKIKMKIPPNADTFAILLRGCEKEGDVARARMTFGEIVIKGMAKIPCNYPPSTVALSSQIAATPKLVVKPKKIFQTYLETSDVSPEARVLCEILTNSTPQEIETALASTGVQPSPELVEEVLKLSYGCPAAAVKFFRWAGVGKKHSAYSWNIMVDLLGKNEMFELLWDTVRSMKQEDLLSVGTFVLVIGSYGVAGRFSEAVMTFNVMEKYGVNPDVVAVNSLLSAMCRGDNPTVNALEFFENIKNKIPPNADTFTILLEGWEKEGDLARAKKTFGEMVIKVGWSPQHTFAYDAFLSTLVRGSQSDEVLKFLQVMKSNSCFPGLKFFTNALDTLVKNNDSAHAILLWDIMVDSGLVPNLIMYNAMIGLLCYNNDFSNAFRLLDKMVFDGAFPQSLTYNMIFKFLIKNKKVHEAGRFFFEMMKNEFPPTHSNCAAAISMFFDSDDPETAVEIWDCMVKNHILPLDDSSNALLVGLCDMGRLTEVSSFAEKMFEKGIKIYESTMIKVKVAFYREGKSTRDLYDDMEKKWKSLWTG